MSNLLKKLAAEVEQSEKQSAPVAAPVIEAEKVVVIRPVPPVVESAPAPLAPAVPVNERGIPVSPWPVIFSQLNEAQMATLTRDEEYRGNLWADNITDGWLGGNLLVNKFVRYRARFVRSEELNADWRGTVWEAIWKEHVKLPVPDWKPNDPAWGKISDAYRERAQASQQSAPQTAAPRASGDEDVPVGS